MGSGHEAEGQHDSQQHRGGEHLADGKGELEHEVFQECSRSQLGPDQTVNFFEEIHHDEQGDEGDQAQAHELEELPGHIVFQDMGTEHFRESHFVYISEIQGAFIRFPTLTAGKKESRRKGKKGGTPMTS